jgi:predicted RNase H-related nuclease YkuK (DUF458 family)
MEYTKLDFTKKKFKKFGGEVIENVTDYLKNYVNTGEDMRIIVGCDSQQKRRFTLYALTIVLYDQELHKGAHVIFMRIREKKERDLMRRLMNESLYALDLSEWLDNELKDDYKIPKFGKCKYSGNYPTKRIEVHVDINQDEGLNKQNRSNMAYHSILGMISGMGFMVKGKPDAFSASCAADLLCH